MSRLRSLTPNNVTDIEENDIMAAAVDLGVLELAAMLATPIWTRTGWMFIRGESQIPGCAQAKRETQRDDVVHQDPEKIEVHLGHGFLRNQEERWDGVELGREQHHTPSCGEALFTMSHHDADICGGKTGSVIDAVADLGNCDQYIDIVTFESRQSLPLQLSRLAFAVVG